MGSFTPPQPLPRLIPTEQILPTMRKIVAELRAVRDGVVQGVTTATARFDSVIQPLINIENTTQGEVGVIAMLRYASPDQATSQASDEACKLWAEDEASFTSRQDLYALVERVKQRAEEGNEKLDPEAEKYLNTLFKEFRRSGLGSLDSYQIQRYVEGKNRVNDMTREYNRNIREDSGGVWFSLKELDGVPQSDLDRFDKNVQIGEDMLCVKFSAADYLVLLQYANNPATRKRMWIADANKLRYNADLFRDIVVQRDENARLLGYQTHASFRLEKRVAKSPEWVNDLLNGLTEALLPQGRRDMDALLALKRKHIAGRSHNYPFHSQEQVEEDFNDMYPWDYWYYTRLLQEEKRVDLQRVAEYFPLEHVMASMLEIFAEFLQLRFIPISPESMKDSRWHDDVRAWSVWDDRKATKDQFIGYLYADLLSRPNKYKGNQNVNIQCGYMKSDGTRVYPATLLMCSFPRPTSSSCALLKHNQLITLFHELGHGIHDLVSKTSYVHFHGHRAPPDFAEAPSVMLENWCWMAPELKRLSRHFTRVNNGYLERWKDEHSDEPLPPEEIPDELVQSLIQDRNVNRSLWYLRQLIFAQFDMAVHHPQNHEQLFSLDLTSLYYDLMENLMLVQVPRQPDHRGHPHSELGHLTSGYDAGYYSYLR